MSEAGDRFAEVHLFEPTGYGGIFQHACQVGQELSRHGNQVVLHTSRQHEIVSLDGVQICDCTWWPRRSGRSGFAKRLLQVKIATRLAVRTVPHVVRSTPRREVLHLEGGASGGLNWLTLFAARRAGRRVVYSPHDTFSRKGPIDRVLVWLAYLPAHAVIVFSQADQQRLRALESRLHMSPLVQLVPRPSAEQQASWRREWRADQAGDVVVLFAGFIRPERRLDLLIESARNWPPERRLAVVGPDWGDWARCAALAEARGVDVLARVGFVDLDDFAAALAAADLVVVPSDRASQSGVLALASALGTRTIGADVGGLAELASSSFSAGDVDDLTKVIEAELDGVIVVGQRMADESALESHLRAYRHPA